MTIDIFNTSEPGAGVVIIPGSAALPQRSQPRVIETYKDPEINNLAFHTWLDDHRGNCLYCQESHTLITHWSGCDGRPPTQLISGLFAQPHVWSKSKSCPSPVLTPARPSKLKRTPGSTASRKPTTRGTSSAG